MKVIDIERSGLIDYKVTLEPNWFEKLFGLKKEVIFVRKTDEFYTFSGQSVFRNPDGTNRPNHDHVSQEIDKLNRSFNVEEEN